MAKGNGYILLHRSVCESFLWSEKPFTKGQAWVDLLLLANHSDKDEIIKGVVVHIKRGQLLRSRQFFAERWGWNVKTVDGYLKTLKTQKMVDTKGTPQGTLITLEKYGIYQSVGDATRTPKRTVERTAERTRTINYKECKRNSKDTLKGVSLEGEKQEKAVSKYENWNYLWDDE